MILLDANILLYAYDARAAEHRAARKWLEATLSASEPVGLCWLTILAFVRIGTNHRVVQRPLTPAEASAIVSQWLAAPPVTLLTPGDRYWTILSALLVSAQVVGPLVTDAALAALAMEHGATLCTADRDFARFSGLKTLNPLSPA